MGVPTAYTVKPILTNNPKLARPTKYLSYYHRNNIPETLNIYLILIQFLNFFGNRKAGRAIHCNLLSVKPQKDFRCYPSFKCYWPEGSSKHRSKKLLHPRIFFIISKIKHENTSAMVWWICCKSQNVTIKKLHLCPTSSVVCLWAFLYSATWISISASYFLQIGLLSYCFSYYCFTLDYH
jgi:hypothetical protein